MRVTLAFSNSATGRFVFGLVIGMLILLSSSRAWEGENRNQGPSGESDLVDIKDLNPHIVVDLKYATDKNFVGKRLYETNTCFLRRSTAVKLDSAQRELESMGLGLKLWDCYRPMSVQRKLWAVLPDKRYVASPEMGSRHNRAVSVDLTLIDSEGRELAMPTDFDDFTIRAYRRYQDLPGAVIKNRALLEVVMKKSGFIALADEWWHFDDREWATFDILDIPFRSLPSVHP